MTFTVRYTDQAAADVFRNAQWWAKHHSVDQALRWEATIEQQILTLKEFPLKHALAPENAEFPYEIRQLLVGVGSRPSYRAVYTVVDDVVHVLAVHRAAQDRLTPDQIDFDP